MGEATALRIAFQLIHVPSQIRHVRSVPLPDGVLLLLEIAAGDEHAVKRACALSACELTGGFADAAKSRVREQEAREAAAFFIEQILFAPCADSYRVLGARSGATAKELRRNMSLLLRWLHPDVQRQGDRSVFARRVSLAWDTLKTPERRAAYDEKRRAMRDEAARSANSLRAARPARSSNQDVNDGSRKNRPFLYKALQILRQAIRL